MDPTPASMKDMLDYIQKKMKKASYRDTVIVYDFIQALMKEAQNET